MAVPVTASEMEPFTPPSLANAPAPPVFTLRPATGRTLREYRAALRREGLVYHSPDAMRAEILRALEALWSPEAYAEHSARLIAHWAASDQNERLPEGQRVKVDPQEEVRITDLLTRLSRQWPALRDLTADNMAFAEDSVKIAASMFVAGWTCLDVSYVREDGRVPLEIIDKVEDALGRAEAEAIASNVVGAGPEGLAFLQLCNAAASRLNLTRSEEKNSQSPSPSSSDLNGSTTMSSGPTGAAGSKASARSKKTRRG